MKNKPHSYTEEFVNINGIDMHFVYYENSSKPVVLFLHGGPGSNNSPYDYFLSSYYNDYTLVNWDQRGAGKTALKNPTVEAEMNIMLDDLDHVIDHLTVKFNTDKVILLGHSWGTVLGTMYVLKKPERVAGYIGVGQVIDMIENEKVGFDELKKRVKQIGRAADIAKLELFEGYPYFEKEKFIASVMPIRKLQRKYGLACGFGAGFIIRQLANPLFNIFSAVKELKLGDKLNKTTIEELVEYSLYSFDRKYSVPVYYILGDMDYQTPFEIAVRYHNTIEAPEKDIYMIGNAGHDTPHDNPQRFFEALNDAIRRINVN